MIYLLLYLAIAAFLYWFIATRENIHPFLNSSNEEFRHLVSRSLFFPFHAAIWLWDRYHLYHLRMRLAERWNRCLDEVFSFLQRMK